MRIAFLTSEYVTEANFAGGLAQYLGRVTGGLVRRGHDVEVFVISDTCEKIEHKGVIVWRVKPKPWLPLRSANLVFRMIHKRRLSRLQAACSTALGLNDALCKRSAEAGFDIAQAASWMATGFFAAANPRLPLIVRASSFDQSTGDPAQILSQPASEICFGYILRCKKCYTHTWFLRHRFFSMQFRKSCN